MKALSLIVSVAVLSISGYYFVTDFNLSGETNHIIYMSLLLILMLICIVGILINVPLIIRERRKMKVLLYQKVTRKALKREKRLHLHLETS
jgi:membrane protein DedA with SNARE-associated domain